MEFTAADVVVKTDIPGEIFMQPLRAILGRLLVLRLSQIQKEIRTIVPGQCILPPAEVVQVSLGQCILPPAKVEQVSSPQNNWPYCLSGISINLKGRGFMLTLYSNKTPEEIILYENLPTPDDPTGKEPFTLTSIGSIVDGEPQTDNNPSPETPQSIVTAILSKTCKQCPANNICGIYQRAIASESNPSAGLISSIQIENPSAITQISISP